MVCILEMIFQFREIISNRIFHTEGTGFAELQSFLATQTKLQMLFNLPFYKTLFNCLETYFNFCIRELTNFFYFLKNMQVWTTIVHSSNLRAQNMTEHNANLVELVNLPDLMEQ